MPQDGLRKKKRGELEHTYRKKKRPLSGTYHWGILKGAARERCMHAEKARSEKEKAEGKVLVQRTGLKRKSRPSRRLPRRGSERGRNSTKEGLQLRKGPPWKGAGTTQPNKLTKKTTVGS